MQPTTVEIGALIRQTRKSQGLTQATLAGLCGTGVRFIIDLEKGKPSCEFGKALMILQMLGVQVQLTPPAILTGGDA